MTEKHAKFQLIEKALAIAVEFAPSNEFDEQGNWLGDRNNAYVELDMFWCSFDMMYPSYDVMTLAECEEERMAEILYIDSRLAWSM